MDKSEIECPIIKTYKLPLVDRIALHYNSFKYLVFSIIIFIPLITLLAVNYFHWQWFLYLAPLEILFVYITVRSLLYLRGNGKYKKWFKDMGKNPDHAISHNGPPGIGKTKVSVHAVYAMAMGSWRKLKREYFSLMGRMQKKDYVMTDDDREIYEAFQYFSKHPGIPCMATNIPVYSKIYKRFSYKLGPSYLKQQRRAPFRLCGLYDEGGTIFNFELSNDKSDKNKGLTIADMVRFCRQHAEFRFIMTEQEGGNVYKGIRNVMARYREFTKIEVVYDAKFLNWIFEKLEKHFTEPVFGEGMSMKKAKYWSLFLDRFEKFINKIGMFKFYYKDYGRRDELLTDKKGGDIIYIPRCSEIEYDSRAFRFAYEARYQKIQMQVFTSMKLSKEEASAFLRATYPKEKEEKKKEKMVA